ncbi:MAG: ABC transporter substrate-binding protein [Erysipelotrichaceae bacterium]
MKKLFSLLLCSLLIMSLSACSSDTAGSTDTTTTQPVTYVEAFSGDPTTFDYVVTALATDHEVNVNFIDGLLEHDTYGNLVASLAESWSTNDDATVWTFNIREGVNWVTNTGEVYAEVTAQDFVTGLRHGAEFDSGTAWLLMGVIEGYTEYLTSDFSDAEWDKVGIKAVDDYTLEIYTEVGEDGTSTPIPYFDSMTTYTVLYPVNQTFLESQGEGCKLGSPDSDTCSFGSLKSDSILYNGAYILSSYDSKSKIEFTKNAAYWDAENVFIDVVTRIYDDGSDPYSVINGFEQGTYVYAGLNPTWDDYDAYATKYEDNAYFAVSNSYVFGLVFNFNRQTFEETNYADDLTLRSNTQEALLNTNFRNAIKYAFDRTAYLATRSPLELAEATLRNVNNIDTAGITSDGTGYYALVEEAYTTLTGETIDLSDGQNPYLDKETALEYIELAKADGIEFPIHLDMLVIETSDALVKQANSMKQSIEENTDGQIIIEIVLRSEDTVYSIAYYNEDPAYADYDISTFTGWGPDYQDPKSFVDIYSPTTGYYMTSVGLETGDGDAEIKETVGLLQYEEYYRAADAITDDLDARYEAFALADAWLLANTIYIPNSQQTRSQLVSYIVPFTAMYASTGTDQYKFKGIQLQDEIVTAEQYAAAEEAWSQGN